MMLRNQNTKLKIKGHKLKQKDRLDNENKKA